MLPNINYLVRKIRTSKTQVLHRFRLRQFTLHQPIPEIQITPTTIVESRPRSFFKHDVFYAIAWDCEYEKSSFESDYEKRLQTPHYDLKEKLMTWTPPGTMQERSPEFLPQIDRSCDGTDADYYMQPDVDMSVEQPEPTPTNPRSSKFDLQYNLKLNCRDYRY